MPTSKAASWSSRNTGHAASSCRRAPGAALVFSGALLHMVTPVTRGRRFAFLPFLYDEAAAALRERNSPHLAEGGGQYRA